MKYSVIVFDLGNVLIPFDYTKPIKYFNNLKPGLGDRFAKLYKDNYHIHRSFEKGELTRNQYLTQMIEWLDGTVTGDEFSKIYSDIFTLNQDVIDLLPKLKKHYTLCLLSNTNEIHKEYGYQHYQFLNNFDKLFLSHEIGAIKPEEKIYRVVERFTEKPSIEHLFIDDIYEYVEGARACGWDGIQFKSYEDLLVELESRKILLNNF
ncbi:MAG: HAD family phosphatase [Bacteroidota bacterium]|jgi:putative hydrolase of the HAD superfamily